MSQEIITDVNRVADLMPTWMGKDFAFDLETTGISWVTDSILGIALSIEGERQYYVVHRHNVEQSDDTLVDTTFIPKLTLRHLFLGLFSQSDVKMIAHNSKFDMHFLLRELGIHVQGMLFDTLLASKIIDENKENGLKDLVELYASKIDMDAYAKYQDLPTYKGYKKTEFIGTPLEPAADYAMKDAEATYKLEKFFAKQLADKGLQEAYYDLWQPMIFVLFEMETKGIALNIKMVHDLMEKYQVIEQNAALEVRKAGMEMLLTTYKRLEDIPHLYWSMYRGVMPPFEDEHGPYVMEDGFRVPLMRPTERSAYRVLTFNPGSSAQLNDLVFKQTNIKLPPLVRLKTNKAGQYAVDKDNIETLLYYAGEDRPRILSEILTWKKASKFISTYLKRFIKDADPNNFYSIYTSFNQDGTNTGRLSSSGPNLQNIPSRGDVGQEARQVFIARPQHKLVVGDYSQMELRVMAHYSKDEQLLAAFAENKDLHILTGSAFAQMEYEDLLALYKSGDPRGKELRQLGKTGNFALMYGMGARKFQRYLLVNNGYEITVEEAQQWIDAFNAMYAGATAWKERVRTFILKNGYVKTISGRYRNLPDAFHRERWIRDTAVRQGINAVIQGSCGDIICSAMIGLQPALKALGGSILLQVHDELVTEVPEEQAQVAVVLMDTFMNSYGLVNKLSLPLVAEASVGDSWHDAKG